MRGRLSLSLVLARFASGFLLLALFIGVPFATAQGAISFVQRNSATPQTALNPVTVTYTAAQTAGNLNVVVVGWNDSTTTVSSISDTMGNVYTLAVGPTVQSGTATQSIYYAKNIKAAAANGNTVTVTFNVAPSFPDIRIAEYSGLDPNTPLDVTAAAQGNSSTSNSGAVTTTNANDLIVGANLVQSSTKSAGSGYTNRIITSPDGDILEDKTVPVAGSNSATATLDSVQLWIMQLVAFKAAPVGPTITTLNPTSGAVGTAVTITGANFGATQGTSTVAFNGTSAGTASSWSATSITVGVPTGATTGNVVVTVSGVASNGVNFTVVVPPSITSLSQSSGTTGTAITITGTNFGATQGTSTVTFNGSSAGTASAWGASSITVNVPANATTGNVVVIVSGVASNAVPFTVTPNITNLSQSSGSVGTPITITGTGFGSSQGTSTVSFNGTSAGTATAWSTTSVTVNVPAGATTGSVVITVGGLASNGVSFTVNTAPTITNLSQSSGPVGTPITIAGTNFGASQGTSTVAFNGTSAGTASAWSATSITVNVPSGATTGNVVVTVSSLASNGAAFTVSPNITNLSQSSGAVGTPVTITGTTFGASQGTSAVTFNGTSAGTASAWSATSITVNVPTGATSGNVVVTVSGVASNGVAFTVAPGITSLSQNSGSVGAPVTITGTNFGASQSTSTVTFNGTLAGTASAWSATSITVNVPTGATTGNVVVTVGGLASNGVNFTVVPPAAFSFIQQNSAAPQASPTSLGVTYTAAQLAGDLNVVVVGWNDSTAAVSSVTDSAGNTYFLAAGPTVQTGTASQAIYYAKNINAAVAGANTVTVTFTVGATHPDVRIAEYSGADPTNPFDAAASAQGNSATSNSGTFTTTSSNDLLVGANVVQSTTTGAGAGYTSRTITADGDILEDQIVTSAGTYSATANLNMVQLWIMQAVTFRAPVGVGSSPTITSLSQSSGAVGTPITITGMNFGANQGTSTVTFHGTSAGTASSWSATSITVNVPAGATTGNVIVTVGGISSNGVAFTVAPSITSLSTNSGTVGTPVTITGANFGASQGTSTVTFNGTSAGTASVWNATSITVNVPTGATTGNVMVTAGGLASNGVSFTVVTPPSITSLSQSSGAPGTQITITGTNFGASQGTSTVTFNGTSAGTASAWGATSITVNVPVGATTGNVVVTVGGLGSNGVAFTVPPSITNLSQNSGGTGTPITITGTNFGTSQGTSTVTFNGTPAATASAWSTTSITVNVPAGATSGNVVVTVSGLGSNGVSFTVVTPPNITSLSQNSGAVGTPITITGTSFGSSQGSSTVTFNGTSAGTASAWSATSITVNVPTGATSGNIVVTVSGAVSNGVLFTVVPSITNLSQSSGAVGTPITITGANFGASQGTSTVTFNGTAAGTAATWSATSITVNVPTGATTGNVIVTVGGLPSNGVSFTVLVAPSISSLSQSSGAVGTPITINGANFGSSQGTSTVTFNGTSAGVASTWGATSITVNVPAGATTGNVVVTVGTLVSNGVAFTVAPSITSLSQNSGTVGTAITITGVNFGASQGTSTVTFNGTSAGTASAWNTTSITVNVPSGATSGNVVVNVGGLASNGVNFVVTVPSGITLLQHTSKDAGSTTSTTLAFASNNTAGNWIAVVVRAGRSNQVFTVSDTRGNTYHNAVQFNVTADTPNGDTVAILYAENIGGGANTVSVSDTINGSTLRIAILEYAGVATSNSFDVAVAAQGTSKTPSSGNATTTASGDLLLGEIMSGNGETYTAGTGYTIEERVPASGTKVIAEDEVQTVAGTASASATLSSSDVWAALLATFKPATGGGSTNPTITTLSKTSGAVGTAVTITGTNFGASQGTSTVTFNGISAGTATAWSATSITVNVPGGASTGNVVVTVGGVASNGVAFTVSPSITSLSQNSGAVGTPITITGTNFGASQGTSSVTFNGTSAGAASAWSASSITVNVPAGATTGNVVVTVSGLASNGVAFTVNVAPSITSLSQSSGAIGTPITLTGTNFGSTQGTSVVTFNGTTAGMASAWSATSITVNVPTGATTGNVVVIANGLTSNGVPFTVVVPPVINNLSQTSGAAGAPVTITGTNFGATQAGSSVTFNGTTAAVSTWSATSIGVTVPAGATTGNVVVTVNGVASNGVAFTVTSPSLTSLGLTQGPVDAIVTITGANFGGTQGTSTVTFNGTVATSTSWSDTSIDVTVPAGATTGNVVVTVNGAASNGLPFTVTPPPNITSITPTSGPVGTVVTINGTNFGPTVGTRVSMVLFNGVSARTNSWSDTQIFVPVPASATTGNVIVSVGGVQSNGVLYTVTNPPSITSLSQSSGPVGTPVTITGTNFGTSQGTSTVTFNGTSAGTASAWSATSVTVNVPPGASTGNVVVNVASLPSNGVNFTVTSLTSSAKFVQSNGKDAGVTTSSSVAFTSNTAAGNWIAVVIRAGNQGQVFTVSDSVHNTYQKAFSFNQTLDSPNGDTLSIYYAENIAGGADTITVSDTISNTMRIAILEYTGIATSNSLDAFVVSQGTNTAPNSGTTSTSWGGDLVLGAVLTGAPENYTAGSGYTVEQAVPVLPNAKLMVEDQIQSLAGSTTANATLGASDTWAAAAVAFKPLVGTAPAPISVTVAPTSASVGTGSGTQVFTATLQNDTQSKGVTWTLSGSGCSGSTCGTLSNVTTTSVTYTGPASVPNPASVTITATSVTDNTKFGTASITVVLGPISVSVMPRRSSETLSQPQQFTATVFNDPNNKGATWMVDDVPNGNAQTGTITGGLFTPGTQAGPHTITATSVSNSSASASVTTAVTDLAGVFTHHNDVARTGQNLQEYALTTATVNPSTFGVLYSCPVDGYVYVEPLYVANLTINSAKHNVLFIATEHDSVYAFDADSPSCVQLWKKSFLGTGITTMPYGDTSFGTSIPATDDVYPEIGITATPVIDPTTNTIYIEAKTKETVGSGCSSGSPCYINRLHALDITTGAEKFNGPVVISAPSFVSLRHFSRPALLLENGNIYVSFGSHGDICNWQGWVMGYNASTLAQIWVWNSVATSGCNGGSIWGGGGGPAADSSGYLYVETGNGVFDGNKNYADAVVKLNPTTGAVADYFSPWDQSTMQANDVDMGSAAAMILPPSVALPNHPLLIGTGKVAILYLLDQTNMGQFHSSGNQDVQEVVPVPPPNTTQLDGGNYGVPAYWNGNIYITGQNFPLSQFTISNGVIATPQFATSTNTFPPRGGIPAVSASGTSNGIVWIVDYTAWATGGPAILDAFDATNVSNLLYSSPNSGSGAAGNAVKFTVPTVANGKVYLGGQSAVTVFGLLP